MNRRCGIQRPVGILAVAERCGPFLIWGGAACSMFRSNLSRQRQTSCCAKQRFARVSTRALALSGGSTTDLPSVCPTLRSSLTTLSKGGGLVDPQMRASNEHLLSVRVP